MRTRFRVKRDREDGIKAETSIYKIETYSVNKCLVNLIQSFIVYPSPDERIRAGFISLKISPYNGLKYSVSCDCPDLIDYYVSQGANDDYNYLIDDAMFENDTKRFALLIDRFEYDVNDIIDSICRYKRLNMLDILIPRLTLRELNKFFKKKEDRILSKTTFIICHILEKLKTSLEKLK